MSIGSRDAVIREVRIGVQTAPGIDEGFEAAVRVLREMRGYHRVGVYTREADRLRGRAFAGPEPDCRSFPLGEGCVGTAGLSGAVQMVPEIGGDLEAAEGAPNPRSECAVPILGGDDVLGVLDAESDRPAEFGPEEQALLQDVAGLLSTAILRHEGSFGGVEVAGVEGWEEDEEGDAEPEDEDEDDDAE